jgi:hypothetical protein
MSKRAPDLYGTEHYAYEYNKNAPTKVQENIIKDIKTYLGIDFEGRTSKEAYEFIGRHHKQMMSAKRFRRW